MFNVRHYTPPFFKAQGQCYSGFIMPVVDNFSGDTLTGAASMPNAFPPVLGNYVELGLGPDDEDPIDDPFDPEPVSPASIGFDGFSAGLLAREVGLY